MEKCEVALTPINTYEKLQRDDWTRRQMKQSLEAWRLKLLYTHKARHCLLCKCNVKSTIDMTKNPSFHARTKHIKVQYHFIRTLVCEEKIILKFCGTKDQDADLFIKALPQAKHQLFVDKIGMCHVLRRVVRRGCVSFFSILFGQTKDNYHREGALSTIVDPIIKDEIASKAVVEDSISNPQQPLEVVGSEL
ncbi:LOW QUALITY PROTEIN: hypothetical protein V2J09_006710 [Rumex salicifolius]